MMRDLTIVIVSFNTCEVLEACLRSLAEHHPSHSYNIVVVDNASADGTPDVVRRNWPDVHVIEPGVNIGFAAANNLGIRWSTAEFVLLLNSDTRVTSGAIDTLVARLRADPALAATGPRIVDGDGRPELSFGRMMSPLAELRQKVLTRAYERRAEWAIRRVEALTSTPHRPDWVSGACLLTRRADALAAGLLDERYFLYAEDVDFCAALRARGQHVAFDPGAEIVHLRGRSRATRPEASERAYRKAHLAFYAKHHPGWLPWLRGYLRLRGILPIEDR
jgi:GT2 family glycosyltransferase